MLGLLLWLLIVALILVVVNFIIDQIPFPANIIWVVKAIVGLIFLIVILGVLFGSIPAPGFLGTGRPLVR